MLSTLLRGALCAQISGAVLLCYWLGFSMPGILAFALLQPPLGCVLIITTTALMSRTPAEPMALWLRALIGEIGAGMRMFLLRQPWATTAPSGLQHTEPATHVQNPQKVPVLLVHGFACNHRIWDDATAILHANGHVVRTVDLEPLLGSIDDYASTVQAAVADLCQATGTSQVALVGHSMGGLAIRAWMRTHGTLRVARVLTLGTPHVGTQLASLACTTNGRQMLWQSPWLAALAQSETHATRALIRIAITPQDNIVYPQRAQVLPGVPVTVFEGIGHLQLCLEKSVLNWVVQQLSPLSLR